MFLERVAQRWWTFVLRGLLAIAFGMVAIFLPAAAVMAMVFVFAVYALVDGALHLGLLFRPRARHSWIFAVAGVISIVAGVVALIWPGITALALFFLIAWSAVALGVIELVGAIAYGENIENEWAYVLSGALWVTFGIILIFWPGPGIVAVFALIAAFALIRGVTLVVAGLRLRKVYMRTRMGTRFR